MAGNSSLYLSIFCTIKFSSGMINFVKKYCNYFTRNHNYWAKRGVNGPKPVPGFGNTLSPFLTEPVVLEKQWVEKYGKVYGIYEANKPILTVADAALIKAIVATDSHVFRDNVTDPILQAPAHPILSQSLVASNGPAWRRVRSLFSPAFSTSRMRQMFGQMADCLTQLTQTLDPYASAGREIDIKLLYGSLTMDVIATSAFGTKADTWRQPLDNPFVANANRVFSPNPMRLLLSILLPTFVLRRVMPAVVDESAHKFFFDMTRQIMRDRRAREAAGDGVKYNDFLELMMSVQKGYGDQSTMEVNGNANTS
ncbi:unnamed protein product, partial [Medioppia subpectinata]